MDPDTSLTRMKVMNVIVVGGSISGLMNAIMLRSLGHNVRILEKQDSTRSDYGAGLGVGPQGKRFLHEYDCSEEQLTYACPGFKFLGLQGEVVKLAPSPMHLTSWTALYYRLRGLFDGLSSEFCTSPPPPASGCGTATFEAHKTVIAVHPDPDGRLTVTYEDGLHTRTAEAHLVIDASGPYSRLHTSATAKSPMPQYAGFVAWRGTVPDTAVSQATNQLFDERFLIFPMIGGSYVIGYKIPGKQGSLELGHRQLNWVWYNVVSDSNELQIILTDRDGHRHSNSIPRGKLNTSEWIKRRDAIAPYMSTGFRELLFATDEPFVSKIHESYSPQLSYHGGRLLVVGDGANLMRPTAGQSTNNAATHCLLLREVLQGKISLRQWEAQVTDEGWQMRLFSNFVSTQYLSSKFWATIALLRWGLFIRWLRLKVYAKRIFKL